VLSLISVRCYGFSHENAMSYDDSLLSSLLSTLVKVKVHKNQDSVDPVFPV
jgi:hypothetical protein